MQATGRKTFWSGLLSILLILPCAASAQVSSITYQGQLEQSGKPFTGAANLQFRLFDQLSGGSQIGSPQTLQSWPVEDGLFQVELDYDPANLEGGDRYLEIRVNGTPLSPRQRVTATPYALIAATTAAGAVDGSAIDPSEVQLRVDGDCPAGEAIRRINQNGSVVCETDDVGTVGDFWSTSGNAAANGDFLGTTNSQPLELRVDGQRVLRIVDGNDSSSHAPNLIMGSEDNVLDESGGLLAGATIVGGGGLGSSLCGPDGTSPCVNTVAADFATVVGGRGNYATGTGSTAMGFNTTASDDRSTAMGSHATASNFGATAMGNDTIASGTFSTAMGDGSVASGNRSTAMGVNSEASGGNSVALGNGNTSSGFAATAMGDFNTASGVYATAMGSRGTAGGDLSLAAGRRAVVRDFQATGEDGDGDGACDLPVGTFECGDEGTFVWADSQNSDFVSTGPDQFLVRAQGGVGFGGAPDDYFDIKSPVEFVSGDGVTENGVFRIRLDGATKFRVFANGGVGVGSSFSGPGTPQNGLSVFGNVQLGSLAPAGGDPLCLNNGNRIALCSSSARYKEAIKPLDLGLDTVLALTPVAYRWTTDDRDDIGFVAEDIAELDERLIIRNGEGTIEGVRYGRLTAVLANAVQTMNQTQRDQAAELVELKSENDSLREQLAELQGKQEDKLIHLEQELALLRAMIAPRIARETP
jgi:hypothetical protein